MIYLYLYIISYKIFNAKTIKISFEKSHFFKSVAARFC